MVGRSSCMSIGCKRGGADVSKIDPTHNMDVTHNLAHASCSDYASSITRMVINARSTTH